ncbi:hypothetical protein HMJ29_11860 [Hymenobacter taeanensis]|uniref:Uncharacterized protein n=1 Tax=Hymenobacter taeanensis TaxID=2735321 RepID=A0A6M6BI70_9BACT|nr:MULTISPECIES: hypothetical protein [Hymenobacter]QJX47598.1 hypothetical protein HMJ29_11860 [Hymenobacter taeanensis]UOQ82918.1 hypothetical protein MUN83_09225 [Hymenobacter sp. 5414T-23]
MKSLSAVICLLTLPVATALAQSSEPGPQTLDDTYGFQGARFETSVSSYKDMVLAEKAGKTQYYRRTGEQKKLGNGEVTDITYGFYQGKLAVVMLKTYGQTNSQRVLEALQEQAGPGVQNNRFAQRYAWNAKRVHMSYDENAMSGDALILITCKKLKEQEMKQDLRSRPTAPLGSR